MMNPLRAVSAKIFQGKTSITVTTLRKWNVVLAILLAVQAIAFVLLATARDVPLNITFLTTDSLQTQLRDHAVTAPAMQQLTTVNIVLVMTAALAVASLFRAGFATVFRDYYESALKRAVAGWRWIELAVCGVLIVGTVGLLAGIYDVLSLLLLTGLVAVMYLAGYSMEVHAASKRTNNTLGPVLAVSRIIAGALALGTLALALAATALFGAGSVGAFVYGLYAIVLVLFAKQMLNGYLGGMKSGKWSSYLYQESWYMVLQFVGLTVFTWVLFIGLTRV